MLDLKIANGKVFIPGSGFYDLDMGVKDGKVVLLSENEMPEANEVLDANGKIIAPGFIDPHIHLGIFEDFTKEVETETRAALAGGVTTVGVFMGGGESYLSQIGPQIDIINQKSSIDVMYHLSIFTNVQMQEMEEYCKQFGVISFKFYMNGVPGVFPGTPDGFIHQGFQKVANLGNRAIGCVHCEDESMVDIAREQVHNDKPNGTLADWAEAHPNMAEEEAIMRVAFLAQKAGNRAYCVHISTKEGSDCFNNCKKDMKDQLFGETTSAYLTVSKHDKVGMLGKMLPPLRDETDIEALWGHVRKRELDTFGTDNVSMNKEVKQAEKGLVSAMPGYPILQTHMPSIITEGYHKRNVPLDVILENATKNPAEIYGIYPQKGTLLVGSDADIVVLDLNKEWQVDSAKMFSHGDFSIHEGRTMKGYPEVVIKNGKIACQDGQIKVEPGVGNYLSRKL